MSLDEENFNSELSERRPSSNPIITAWQIQSTLNNMEEFIRFIEQFQTQRQQLENILPFIQRIKRVQEEKEYFNKQLLDLAKFIYPSDINQKQETLIKSENKQKSTIQNHFKRLSNFTKEINNSNAQNSKKIVQLKKRIQESKKKRQQDRIEKKKHLSQQLNQNIQKQINSIEEKINQQNSCQKKTQSQTAYEQFIGQYIFQKLRSQKDLKQQKSLSQSLISQSPSIEQSSQRPNGKLTVWIDNNSLKRDFGEKFNELGQIKCKLFSLQDKKRKITVKNIMANKVSHIKQVQYDNLQLSNTNRKFKVIKAQYNKTSQISQKEEMDEKKQNGLFGSFLAIFSNQNVKNEQKDSSKKNNSGKKQGEKQILKYQKEISNSQQKMQLGLQQIDDKQVKLKIAQIHAEILQLREQINIIINQNIFDQILGSMMRLKSVNEQLQSYIDQLRRLMTIIQAQRLMGQVHLPDLQIFKGNQQVRFFLNFIQQRLITRQSLMKNLFENITYSISVAKKYISTRLAQIQDSLLLLIQSNHTKDKKIKALQTLQSRPQFLFINSGLDSLSSEINQILELKLIPLQKLLKTESNQSKKIYANKTHNLFQQNKFNKRKEFQDILSCEIDAVENIIFSQPCNSDSKSYGLMFNFYSELSKKILDLFY